MDIAVPFYLRDHPSPDLNQIRMTFFTMFVVGPLTLLYFFLYTHHHLPNGIREGSADKLFNAVKKHDTQAEWSHDDIV